MNGISFSNLKQHQLNYGNVCLNWLSTIFQFSIDYYLLINIHLFYFYFLLDKYLLVIIK
jgi:hypothetical protein